MKFYTKSLLAILGLAAGLGGVNGSAATVDVVITNLTFSPSTVYVDTGDTVRWTNSDYLLYNVTSDTALWTSPTLAGGQTYSYTFSSNGTYAYHCAYHPTMKGTVVVQTKLTGFPGQVTLLSPTNSEILITHKPALKWSTPSPNATWYYLWINKDGEFYQQEWVQNGNTNDLPKTGVDLSTLRTNRWSPTNEFPNGSYTWAVQTYNAEGYGSWSAVGSFVIYAGAPGVATLILPTNTAYATSRRPDLQWTNAPPAATWNQVWINKDGQFYLKEWIEGAQIWRSTNDLPNGMYTWGVQTWNADGYGAWSRVSSFTITSMVPGMATLLTPTNGEGGVGRRPQLTWSNATPAATWYNLWINKDGEFFHQEWMESVTRWSPTNDLASGRYSWGVQTWNSEGYGPWSSNSIFTIAYTLPSALILDLAVVVDSTTVRYQWNADMAATWYELWILENGKTRYDKWYYTGATTGLIKFEIEDHTSGATYQWYVRGWNPDGYGVWSGPMSFTMP